MKFKAEVSLLCLALSLFVMSAFFYSYQTGSASLAANLASYPYQGYGIAFVSVGAAFMVAAFVSYSKRGNSIYAETFEMLSEKKSK